MLCHSHGGTYSGTGHRDLQLFNFLVLLKKEGNYLLKVTNERNRLINAVIRSVQRNGQTHVKNLVASCEFGHSVRSWCFRINMLVAVFSPILDGPFWGYSQWMMRREGGAQKVRLP